MRKLCRFLMMGVFSLLCVPLGAASAETYNVSASVPYPVPSIAASFDNSLQGSVQTVDVVQLSGTCQVVAPYSVVSIWRQGQSLGSVACDVNGTFRIPVQLLLGVNELIARTSNIDMQYGPDSSAVNITYNLPPTGPPVANQTSSSGGGTVPVAVAAASDLKISTEEPFSVLDTNNTVTINIIVGGGAAPYIVTINWGDGTTETKTIDKPGNYVFTHTYEKQAVFEARAIVTDVLGVQKEYSFSIVTRKMTQQPSGINSTGASGTQKRDFTWVKWVLWFVFLGGCSVGLILLGYWLGGGRRRIPASETKLAVGAKSKKHKKAVHHFHFTGMMRWLTVFVIISVLLALALRSIFVGPSVASIARSQDVNSVKGVEVTLKEIDTGYFKARIPESFVQKTQTETPNGPVKGQYMYAENGKIYSRQVGLTIGAATTDSVEDISPVRQRRIEPENYAEAQPIRVGDVRAIVFRAVDNTETSAFFIKDGLYGAIVVTDQVGGYDRINSILGQIAQSWQWK